MRHNFALFGDENASGSARILLSSVLFLLIVYLSRGKSYTRV